MIQINYLAVVVAAVASVVLATIYYTSFGKQYAALRGISPEAARARPPAGKVALEVVRCLVLALVIAGLASKLGVTDVAGSLLLGLVLWVGFPVVLLAGSVQWDDVNPRLAVLHAGDWLLKLLLIGVIVGVWH